MHVEGSLRELLSDGVGDSGIGLVGLHSTRPRVRLSFIAEQGRSGREGGSRAASVRRPNEASVKPQSVGADEAMITTKKRRGRMKKKFPPFRNYPPTVR